MKKSILTSIALTLCFFITNDSFAQVADSRDAGGSDDGFIHQPCPVSFKRNNGNGWGVCNGDAQIRVAFSEMPTIIPQLTAIWYTKTKDGSPIALTTVLLPVDGVIIDKTQPYFSYCLTGAYEVHGNSQGNIPPAVKLVLEFKYPNGQVCSTDFEEL